MYDIKQDNCSQSQDNILIALSQTQFVFFTQYLQQKNQLIKSMGKKAKTTQKQKQQHFLIFKGTKGTYYKSKIQVDFSPTKQCSNLPTFNQDHTYYTPAFIIPSLFSTTSVNYESQHQNKVLATAEKSQQNIFVPKPKPKKNYCAVCSREYEDYLQHICSTAHKFQLKNSKFYLEISNLCEKMRTQHETTKMDKIEQICSKNTLSSEMQEEDQNTKQTVSNIQRRYHYETSGIQEG